jgi:hypothetical protein
MYALMHPSGNQTHAPPASAPPLQLCLVWSEPMHTPVALKDLREQHLLLLLQLQNQLTATHLAQAPCLRAAGRNSLTSRPCCWGAPVTSSITRPHLQAFAAGLLYSSWRVSVDCREIINMVVCQHALCAVFGIALGMAGGHALKPVSGCGPTCTIRGSVLVVIGLYTNYTCSALGLPGLRSTFRQ